MNGRRVNLDLACAIPALVHAESSNLALAWANSTLSIKTRSLVTVAALISRNAQISFIDEFARALDNEVTPLELSEVILHLAYYAGWGNAWAAEAALSELCEARGIQPEDLAPAFPVLNDFDEEAEAVRAKSVSQKFDHIAPTVARYTESLIYEDLWRRPGLLEKDRYFVTIAALITTGNVSHIPFHLSRGMSAGITEEQVGEALTQLAFYAGWPNVFSALPIVSAVFGTSPQGNVAR